MADKVRCSVVFFGPDVDLEVDQTEYDYFKTMGWLVEDKKSDKATKPGTDQASK